MHDRAMLRHPKSSLRRDRKVSLGELSRLLGRKQLRLADEGRIAELFSDCDRGAVPALGVYNLLHRHGWRKLARSGPAKARSS
jgi:Aminoacyl-tRNA editing domain